MNIKRDAKDEAVDEITYLDGKYKIFESSKDASVVGDTVGDPLKDTSGPSINILIKLSSITSVVFGTLFVKTSFLLSHQSKA